MEDENDAQPGGEQTSLTLDEAVKRYAGLAKQEPQGQPAKQEPDESEPAEDADEPEADEAEGEDAADANPDPDSQADDEDAAEPEGKAGTFAAHNQRVKLPDGTELTVASLIAGNMKDGDYRKKTAEAAELKRSVEADKSSIDASKQEIAQQRDQLVQLLQAVVRQPDRELLRSDPVTYFDQLGNYNDWVSHIQSLEQQTKAQRKAAEDKTAAERKSKVQAEAVALAGKLPELRDKEKAKSFFSSLETYALAQGLSRGDLAALQTNHAYVLALDKARKWDKLQDNKAALEKKGKTDTPRPPVVRGGKRQSPGEQRARSSADAMNRLKETGRLDDGVAAYLALQKR